MMRSRIKGFTAALSFSIPTFSVAFFLCNGQAIPARPAEHGKDGPPVVKITAPDNNSNSAYNWNSLVNYSVVVSYQGKSTQYQEISSNQVLIRTTYIPDVSKGAGELGLATTPTPAGLLDIIRSNCVGCHGFKAKAMGPSFAAIAARYPDSQASMDTLSRYIREGSTGVWGQRNMPPHTELMEDQLHAMALWIVKHAADPNVNYYVGTDGTIRMEAPATPSPKGGIILTASYTAPATSADQEQAPHGEDTVIVQGR
jgi:cytochrome c